MDALQIRASQEKLAGLGLYKGKIDGIVGPRTETAVRAFQRLNPPLKVDGKLGPKTYAVLFDEVADDERKPKPGGITPSKIVFPKRNTSALTAFYGDRGENQAKVALPYAMRIAWDLRKTVHTITLHEKLVGSAGRCFQAAKDHYGYEKIKSLGLDLFGGSLNVRLMRGSKTQWSVHSWGAAIDFDPARNQLKWDHTRARLAKAVYVPWFEIWEAEGWYSLGRAEDRDWMHIEATRGP